MTDKEIVNLANALAREIYTLRGYNVPEGYRFHLATHPHEREAWTAACAAFAMLKETDPDDALDGLDEE